jgi:hypothetical protein
LRIPDGKTVVLAGVLRQASNRQRLVLLTPHVVRLDGDE